MLNEGTFSPHASGRLFMENNPDGYIVKTPGVCGGKPRIAGHRIRVQDIVVWHEQQGWSPDEIVSHYPQLSLSKVYAALAYYHDHREEIRQEMRDDEAFVEEFKKNHSDLILPSSDTHAPHHPLPPR
jgi:uncharacterized protein (DUF433 family)